MKKLISMLFFTTIIMFSFASHAADFRDVKDDSSYAKSVERISALGIMNGYGNSEFKPYEILTREQFARVIISACGLLDDANSQKGSTVFPDVSPNSWSTGFINLAIKKGYIKGMLDGNFHPQDGITFAQVSTILVRALNYTDSDISGLWPVNYVEKAKALGICEGLSFDYDDNLPRWAISVMIDRLLDTNIKKASAQDADNTFAQNANLYTECVILATSSNVDTLSPNQVITDKGTFYSDYTDKMELGGKYAVVFGKDTESNKIKTIVQRTNESKPISIIRGTDSNILYSDSSLLQKSMKLPEQTTYYYKGSKYDFSTLNSIIKANTSIIFGINKDDSAKFDYAIVMDPTYSAPEVALSEKAASSGKIGSIDLPDKIQIVREGKSITPSDIEKMDVVYKVTDFWGKNPYIQVITNKAEGNITAILPDKVSPQTLQVESKNYDIGKSMPAELLTGTTSFKVDDKVSALLGYDGKVAYIVAYTHKTGPFEEYLVLGQPSYNNTLMSNQILTDKGTFYVGVPNATFEDGNKYKLVVDGDTIVKVGDKVDTVSYYTVASSMGGIFNYTDLRDRSTKTITLPQTIKYYYNGAESTYTNILGVLSYDTTISFAKNDQGTGYKYAVVFPPLYSDPEVVEASPYDIKIIQDSDLLHGDIIRNREHIEVKDIVSHDVVYVVTDMNKKNSFIQIYNTKGSGVINGILPNIMSPTSIQIGTTTYKLSKYANDWNYMWGNGDFKEAENVTAVLDKNGDVLKLYLNTVSR